MSLQTANAPWLYPSHRLLAYQPPAAKATTDTNASRAAMA